MNPSQGAHLTSHDGSDPSERDLSPTELPTVPPADRKDTLTRPPLTRLPPGRLSEISSTSPGSDKNTRSADADATGSDVALSASKQGDNRKPIGPRRSSNTEAERLDRIRDAVTAKLMAQQRKRGSYGASTSPAASRVSPITEEGIPSISPSLTAAFASPGDTVRPLSTVSTESTESARTVRASVPSTPAESRPLRTPSYPFPIVPGSARPWQSPLHQPFTGLSPTGLADFSRASANDASRASIGSMVSTASTPIGATSNFLPPDARYQGPEDPRFPTPNLYDAVLQLNAEPGMDQWWSTVTNLMHDHFKAERVTLAVPLDPTDIENVPWGQKATFNMCGREEFVSRRKLMEQQTIIAPESAQNSAKDARETSLDAMRDTQMRKLHPERLRPRLDSRHSYAGHGRETKEYSTEPPARVGTRPLGLQRTVTLAASTASVIGPGRGFVRGQPSSGSSRIASSSDPEFSSVAGGLDAGPYTEVFSTLQGLDHEAHPLIEPGGINRVLERGRVVTVTRDYSLEDDAPDTRSSTTEVHSKDSTRKSTGVTKSGNEKVFDVSHAASVPEASSLLNRDYQEYEQYPISPWAQSPAPSPAIQSDEEDNPFFATASTEQVEDSFNPASTPKDYMTYGQVEAIGVDRASTVIHIPLVHPTLSPPMYSLNIQRRSEDRSGMPHRGNTIDPERKAPVAILSVLSPNVPYPVNLMNSIKLLGPHLATSFTTAQQFTSTFQQALSHHQQSNSQAYSVWTGSMMMERTSLANIMHAEPEHAQGSLTDSVTSPSDYSGRSHNSPSSSIVGTPGWDPASHGWTASRSAAATPYSGTEMVENYFDAHKRSAQRRGSVSSSHQPTSSTSGRFSKNPPGSDSGSSGTKSSSHGSDEQRDRYGENKSKITKSTPEHASTRDSSPPPGSPKRSSGGVPSNTSTGLASRHTLLHSYGANLASTFGAESATSGSYASEGAHAENMPPPSERLLRTIIDSVPVQIFTATPNTGQLSWVNSKYLIYRGQETRQVLQEPWNSIHPEERADFLAAWNRSLRTAQQLQQKVRLKRFDGAFRWFYVRAAPLKDKRQKIVHWIGTMMDFHDQHLAETTAARQLETEASEAKYRALANSSPQIVFAVSRARGITFCNSQWVQYSGQTEAEALGAGFMSYVNPDDLVKCRLPTFDDASQQPTNVPTSVPFAPRRTLSASAASSSGSSETERADVTTSPIGQMPQRQLSELASTGILKVTRDADGRPSYSTEVRLKSRDGEFRWHLVRVLLAQATSSADTEETWYGTCTDINDHKTLERDLKETMDEKSRFLSNMSHEIRTPLNGITGMVNFLIDSSLTPEQMEHVSIIRASTEGLRGLINDILDLSKAEAGMIQLKMDWLYVRAILEEVNDLTSAMAIDKGLELNYLVEEDVPSQVKGDRFRLRQILLNVIGNAIKFTQKVSRSAQCCDVR
nr:peroxide stress-activated histidine kinase mak1 [Quercus suber]